MKAFLQNFHQNVAKDFISELRIKSIEYELENAQQDHLHQLLNKLEHLIQKADTFENNNFEEYD